MSVRLTEETDAARQRVGRRSRGVLVLAGALLAACSGEPAGSGRLGDAEQPFEPFRHELGRFTLELAGTGWEDARLRASHPELGEVPALETVAGRAFLEIARGRSALVGTGRNAHVEDAVQERCSRQTVESAELELYVLRITGRLKCRVLERAYELFVVPEGRNQLRLHVRLEDPSFNRIAFVQARAPGERFFGFGAREAFAQADGRLANLVVGLEGASPTTLDRLRARFSPVFPGSRAPAPHALSSRGPVLWLENAEYAAFDLATEGVLRTEVHARELTLRVAAVRSPEDRVRLLSRATGELRLPAWIHSGPLVAVEGGAAAVRERLAELASLGTMPAALFVRDAAPAEVETAIDGAAYPDWQALAVELDRAGIRLILPAGPLLPEDSVLEPHAVRDDAGDVVPVAGGLLVDLARADARARLRQETRARRVEPGARGLRLRGGEGLPFGVRAGDDGASADEHNRFAAQATSTASRAFLDGEQGVLLAETAYVGSPGHVAVLVAGALEDEATLARVLSAGISGFPVSTVSAGGAAALGLAGFMPLYEVDARVLDAPEGRAALVRAGRIHAAWAGYRAELVRQVAERGLPILRPLWLYHPEEPAFQSGRPESFLIGSELLVVPNPQPDSAEAVTFPATLPPGRWIDLFRGDAYGVDGGPARRFRLTAPPGLPAVLYPDGSIVGLRLRKVLAPLAEATVKP